MDGCEAYQIKPLERFETSYVKLVKNHYRRNEEARNVFEELIEDYVDQLRKDPFCKISDDEGFPKGSYRQDFEFRKIRFRSPGLQGDARYCRLMYVVHKPQRIVYLVWIYTHIEFGRKNNTRPPDKDLQKEFDIIRQDIEDLDETENQKIAPHSKAGEI